MNKRIALFALGGTISMLVDPDTGAAVPKLPGGDLVSKVPGIERIAAVDVFDVALVGGSQVTPELVFQLKNRVEAALKPPSDYDGAVITQGTDTVEEASYMMDLLLRTEKPVVHTAAMRNNSETGADGLRNIASAVRVAASDEAYGKGVLVVANDEVYSAADVTKLHTLNNATFKAPGRGPLGYVLHEKGKVVFFHACLIRQKIDTDKFALGVPIVKFGFGLEPDLLWSALNAGVPGIVLEGAGAGNFPESVEQAIEAAVVRGVPVVLTSRCPEGFISDIYGYPGAGKKLTSRGAILGQGLSSVKARVKLMLALGYTRNVATIRSLFEYLY